MKSVLVLNHLCRIGVTPRKHTASCEPLATLLLRLNTIEKKLRLWYSYYSVWNLAEKKSINTKQSMTKEIFFFFCFWLQCYCRTWVLEKNSVGSHPSPKNIVLFLATVLLWSIGFRKKLIGLDPLQFFFLPVVLWLVQKFNWYTIPTEKNYFASGYSTTMLHGTEKAVHGFLAAGQFAIKKD